MPLAFATHADDPTFPLALQPGDVLLYARSGVFNWIISRKIWSRITHVEVAVPTRTSPTLVVASRNREGCGFYAFDPQGLALVLRPVQGLGLPPFNTAKAIGWFHANRVGEQGYDFVGLLNFAYARAVGRDNGKMFCSELAVRFARQADHDYFREHDADTISPRDFLLTPYLEPTWRSPDEWARYHKQLTYEGL